ncbi:MAG: alpha/beta hydrolase [Acidimicrobiales bacterium]|nr:alpha/beta hydrolase [Acidimicrobiales bacterium]
MTDEGTLDPWVADWFAADPNRAVPFAELSPEILPLARGPEGGPVTREIAEVRDDHVDDIPIRIYRGAGEPTGLVVYFHGGGYCIGSIGLMDNVAREIAHWSGAVVVSVGYRLAPENPYPAGLDDCETVTRWAVANAENLGAAPDRVAVAGESAGGNLSATVALRLRDAGDVTLAGQVLLYPGTAGSVVTDSMREFDGLILSLDSMAMFWGAYSAGRDLDADPYAAPLSAASLSGLPPAVVVLGGSDLLRDEGRAYAGRLRDDGVVVDEVCYPGQPHGFLNLDFPAAAEAFEHVGGWLRTTFSSI